MGFLFHRGRPVPPDANNLTPGEARAMMTAVITLTESVQTLQRVVALQTEELLGQRAQLNRQADHIDALTKVLVSQDGVWGRMAEQVNDSMQLVHVVAQNAKSQLDEMERNRPNIILHQHTDFLS